MWRPARRWPPSAKAAAASRPSAASDVKTIKTDPGINVTSIINLGFHAMYFNVGNTDRAKTPLGQDKRVRQALELSIDRTALNEVVFEGQFTPGNQTLPPNPYFHDKATPIKARDIAKAKALSKAAGVATPVKVEMSIGNDARAQATSQVIQSMAAEAGFDLSIRAAEFAAMLSETSKGNFQTYQSQWSGRPDPDGNIHQFVTCKGSFNDWKYCNPEVDRLLNEARTLADPAERKKRYDAANVILADELPLMVLWHEAWIWRLKKKISGFVPHPDGMIRLPNMAMAP